MNTLKIVTQKNKALNKSQATFNRLTKRIGTLTNKIAKEKKKLDTLHQEFANKIAPLENQAARHYMDMGLLLHQAALKYKYGKVQKETIGNAILFLCNMSFANIAPTEEEEAMFDYWSETSYKEELEEEQFEMKASLMDILKHMHGIDIDLSDFEDTPEGFAKFQQQMQEELDRNEEKQASEFSNKKKTKRQREQEQRLKVEEVEKLKSIRGIYISLAKVLHPDTNTAGLEMVQKEELMKRVTVAYKEKDLVTLLKLEMEWVATESDNLDNLSEEKLKLYIVSLKERVSELEQESFLLYNDPKYHTIVDLMHATEKAAMKEIKRSVEMMKSKVDMMQTDLLDLRRNASKKHYIDFAEDLCDGITFAADDFDDFDDEWDEWDEYTDEGCDFEMTDEMRADFDELFGKRK